MIDQIGLNLSDIDSLDISGVREMIELSALLPYRLSSS